MAQVDLPLSFNVLQFFNQSNQIISWWNLLENLENFRHIRWFSEMLIKKMFDGFSSNKIALSDSLSLLWSFFFWNTSKHPSSPIYLIGKHFLFKYLSVKTGRFTNFIIILCFFETSTLINFVQLSLVFFKISK